MAKNVYLQVEFKSGLLFQYSKDSKEGFEEHKSTKNKISYRKYWKGGLYGVYRGTSIRVSDFGKEISIHMIDKGGDNVYVSLPLFDQQKNIAAYAESYISIISSMELNYVYRIYPYAMENERGYKNYGVSIRHADMHDETIREDHLLDKLSFSYEKKSGEVISGDVPMIKWTKDFDGSMKKDCSERNEYLYNVLMKFATEKTVGASNKVTKDEAPEPYTGTFIKEPETTSEEKESNKPEDNNDLKSVDSREVSEEVSTETELPF